MPGNNYAIEVCKKFNLLKESFFCRSSGRYCADLRITDPITHAHHKKYVSSTDETKLAGKVAKAEDTLYRMIRVNFLMVQLQAEPLTLSHYLKMDLRYLKEQWPSNYGEKDYTALKQCADALGNDPNKYKDVEPFIYALNTLSLDRQKELIVLRMLRDIIDSLIHLGLYLHANPLPEYYKIANQIFAQEKAAQRTPKNQALSDRTLSGIYTEYRKACLSDARYLALPLYLLGLSAAQISALNWGDAIETNGARSLLIRAEMVKVKTRYRRGVLQNEWDFRQLPIDWFWADLVQWEAWYTAAGISDTKNTPLCACGRRKHPKRCTPTEIEDFLNNLLKRHLPDMPPELRPSAGKRDHSYMNVVHKVYITALQKTFLTCGHDILKEDAFSAQYLFGKPALTVDDRVYLDFTTVRMQHRINDQILRIFNTMGMFQEEEK